MSHPPLSYPATYIRLLAVKLRLKGELRAPLLAGTSLQLADIDRADAMVSEQDQYTVIANAMRLAGRPTFALEIGNSLSLAAHGLIGQLLSSSPALGAAWVAIERFQSLRLPLARFTRETGPDYMAMRIEPLRPVDAVCVFLIELLVLSIQSGIELLLGRQLREAKLQLGYAAPAHADEYARYVHSPHVFGAECTAWFIPVSLLDHPNPFHDAAVFAQVLQQCEQLEASLRAQPERRCWRARVNECLAQHTGRIPTLIEIAAELHLSSRTLIRHLKAEGTTYQALLDRQLSQRALALFAASTRCSVEDVGLALGYRDATAFRRAFKRWFGAAPRIHLQRQS